MWYNNIVTFLSSGFRLLCLSNLRNIWTSSIIYFTQSKIYIIPFYHGARASYQLLPGNTISINLESLTQARIVLSRVCPYLSSIFNCNWLNPPWLQLLYPSYPIKRIMKKIYLFVPVNLFYILDYPSQKFVRYTLPPSCIFSMRISKVLRLKKVNSVVKLCCGPLRLLIVGTHGGFFYPLHCFQQL